MTAWPKPDWKPVQPFPFVEASRAFTGGARAPSFLALHYFETPAGALVALASFGAHSEGPPGRAHGGATLTALDEALGAACWHAGHRVLTVKLTTDFRQGVPIGSALLVETRIVAHRLRLVFAEGRMVGPHGEVYATAQGRFMEIPASEQPKYFGRG